MRVPVAGGGDVARREGDHARRHLVRVRVRGRVRVRVRARARIRIRVRVRVRVRVRLRARVVPRTRIVDPTGPGPPARRAPAA